VPGDDHLSKQQLLNKWKWCHIDYKGLQTSTNNEMERCHRATQQN